MGRVRFDVRGARTLVTGAGGGIGSETALLFANEGAIVIGVDLDLAAAEKTAAMIGEAGGECTAAACDVTDPAAVQSLADKIHEAGPLQVLVNNAGVGMSGRFGSMSAQDWEWIRSVNLDGVVNCLRSFAPPMLSAGRGHVVNLSSGLGYTPRATEPAYCTTKAGVLALSQCLRADWSKRGVGVSAICPGIINTGIIAATRFLGDQAGDDVRNHTQKVFNRGHHPSAVATSILSAVARNRAVVPVGWEAWIGWYLHRYAPVAVQQFVARQSPP